MSYSHYQHTVGASYPYAAYHPATAGAYTQAQGHVAYQGAYASGVTGYGAWPYPYTYLAQQPLAQAPRPTVQTTVAPPPVAAAATPRTTTFTSYTPSLTTAGSGTAGRGRKQANFRGLFTKERACARSLGFSGITKWTSKESDVRFWRRPQPSK